MKASTRNNLKAWAIEWESTRAAPDFPSQYHQRFYQSSYGAN